MIDPADYRPHNELKALMRKAGLTPRDFAAVLNLSPSAIYGQLNGNSPLSKTAEQRITEVCKVQIKRMTEEKKRASQNSQESL